MSPNLPQLCEPDRTTEISPKTEIEFGKFKVTQCHLLAALDTLPQAVGRKSRNSLILIRKRIDHPFWGPAGDPGALAGIFSRRFAIAAILKPLQLPFNLPVALGDLVLISPVKLQRLGQFKDRRNRPAKVVDVEQLCRTPSQFPPKTTYFFDHPHINFAIVATLRTKRSNAARPKTTYPALLTCLLRIPSPTIIKTPEITIKTSPATKLDDIQRSCSLNCVLAAMFAGLQLLPQVSVFPPDKEAQRGAVALQDSLFDLLDDYRFILAVHQPVPGQHGPVEVAGLVEPPVLGDAQRGVPGPVCFRRRSGRSFLRLFP